VCVCLAMQMSSVKHENVNRFVGVCLTAPNVALVMLYAHKGCLRDVLANDNIKINTEFLHSFVMDIASVRISFRSFRSLQSRLPLQFLVQQLFAIPFGSLPGVASTVIKPQLRLIGFSEDP